MQFAIVDTTRNDCDALIPLSVCHLGERSRFLYPVMPPGWASDPGRIPFLSGPY